MVIRSPVVITGTVSRKLLDTQLCSRLFSKLSQLHDEATDTAKLDELQRRLNTVDSELEKLTETLIQLPNITQIQEALRVKQEEKDELIVQLSREKARVKSVSSLDLSGLDMESVEGRTEAQIIIKRLVKEIVVSGNEKLVDIYLHNGNMIRGFPLDGKDDHTLTLEEATDEMQSLDDMLIFGEPVTRIYPAGDMEEGGRLVFLLGFTEYFLSFEATRPALLLALVTLVFSASVKSE